MFISRLAGLVIVFALLILFLVSSALGKSVDHATTLAFLGIATGLLGIPAGWYLVRRNGAFDGSEK
jgi:hypothetical protein